MIPARYLKVIKTFMDKNPLVEKVSLRRNVTIRSNRASFTDFDVFIWVHGNCYLQSTQYTQLTADGLRSALAEALAKATSNEL